jgi:hypothetical protein
MFNQEQVKELLGNKNIKMCSSKSITFNSNFKLEAVKKYYNNGYSSKMIFEEAGINLKIIGTSKAKDCLARWRRIYNKKGEKELIKENRGSSCNKKVKIEFKSKEDEIEYLKTKVDYLNAENSFLAQLRGLKRE